MSDAKSTPTARTIVDDVFGRNMARELWTGNYDKALPLSIQDFDLSAVLPAVFYMFRFGYRRGKGRFLETFGHAVGTAKERRQSANIDRVAAGLAETKWFEGFEEATPQAILGDLLLCFCLENSKRALGRDKQVQRVAPTHYMASWVDLPNSVAHLRYVPEMIVAMLADQDGVYVERTQPGERSWFAIGQGFKDNELLKAFHQGVIRKGEVDGRTSDSFQEDTPVGLDQLLMIRLAQQLGVAPDKLRGGDSERISNQRPIAEQATRQFSEDIRRFVRAYAPILPRHAFVELLEACMAVGLTTIITSTIELLFAWANTGDIRQKSEQQPAALFVDCSNGVERDLRMLAEQSMDDFMRQTERLPTVLMALRLLDYGARYDPKLKKLTIPTRPYATTWLNVLGQILYKQREEAQPIWYDLERKTAELAERLQEDYSEITLLLRNDDAQPNPVWRLAEALTVLQGRGNTQHGLVKMIDSALLVDQPNGLAIKRSVTRKAAPGAAAKKRDVRFLVFTDAVLDYLVHLQVLPNGHKSGYRPLSFREFVQVLRKRYGFCIDQAPPGMAISNELLQRNRLVLERRLRDLGLLVGVNDAESMKQLQPRFQLTEEQHDGVD